MMNKNLKERGYFFEREDEGRTRDIQLGRLTLYQLSYFRMVDFDFNKFERKTRVELATFSLKADALPTELLPHGRCFSFVGANIK